MKNLFVILFLSIISIVLYAQESSNQINKQLSSKTWVDGETRNINGYQVTRVNGADYGNSRNSSSGMITSVAYHDADENHLNPYLEFYITRYEQSLANMKWFMIIIRDEDDKDKILEQKLDYKAAELPKGNYYWNYTTIPLPENIHPPFYVYIRDRNIPDLTSFKFKVE
jgi:hypothetical protein